mgnify:CR=1 FL=1
MTEKEQFLALTGADVLAIKQESREAKYLEIIKYILDKMKIDTDRQPYQTELHDATAISWKGHLSRHKILGEDLLALYDDAVAYRAKTDRRNPFCIDFGVLKIPQNGKIVEITCNHEE